MLTAIRSFLFLWLFSSQKKKKNLLSRHLTRTYKQFNEKKKKDFIQNENLTFVITLSQVYDLL